MSTDLESDSELRALRNELLTGLQKKRNSFDTTSVYVQDESTLNPIEEKSDPVKKAEEEEDELEMLRLQALSAKKSRDNSSTSSSSLKVKSNVVPGRFRYDKGSDDEEDEDEDEDEEDELYQVDEAQDKHETSSSLNETQNEEPEQRINDSKDSNNNTDVTGRFSTNNSQQRNYPYNYQTYRTECSKLMSNDEYDLINQYEPQPHKSTALPSDFDLRNLLRQKTVSQNQQNMSLDSFPGNGNIGFYTDYTNPDDIVYSEPITRPIEISNSFITRGGYRNNSRNFNRFQNSYCVNNFSSETVNQKHRYERDAQGKALCHSVSNMEGADNSFSTDSGSDDEESFLSNKKLKSVIVKAVMSSDTTKSETSTKGDRTRSRSRSRDFSRNRHHKRIK